MSGGGYIGSWFHAWVKRATNRFGDVYRGLQPESGAAEVQFLRRYSNYLTPTSGLLSADTWTMISIWLRNTLLNQTILFLAFAALLLLPRSLSWLPDVAGGHHATWILVALLMTLAVVMIGQGLPKPSRPAALEEREIGGQPYVQLRVVLPILLSCLLLSGWIYPVFAGKDSASLIRTSTGFGLGLLIFLAVVSRVGDFSSRFGAPGSGWRILAAWTGIPLMNIACATVGAGALYLVGSSLQCGEEPVTRWSTLVWGTPFFLLLFTATVIAQIGLLGRNFTDDRREWWSRLGAWLIIYFLAWTAVFATSIYGPLLLLRAHEKLSDAWASGVLLGWAGTVAAGIWAGNSSKTGEEKEGPRLMNWVAMLAPPLFLVGVTLMESLVVHLVALKLTVCAGCAGTPSSAVLANSYTTYLDALPWWQALLGMVVLAIAATIVGWRVDINEFSLHQFYRNRLVRCYLGASRERPRDKESKRNPNPFTGFDGNDEVDLKDLRPDAGYTGPYPIVNCALNLVHGKNLAWQERKATSYAFTPLYCGFDADDWATDHPGLDDDPGAIRHGYCPTGMYSEGTVKLGQAMAISGAAASPNAGYHSSPAAALLMTIFDVRLGWWIGNPSHPKGWKFTAPHFGFKYLLFELLGLTDSERRFVYLSDGGHFENLALFELVHRRCRFIVVSDAEQDGAMAFEGLGNAIRKCRTDFGVEIDINIEPLRPDPVSGLSTSHCVVGDVVYPERDENGERLKGRLVYIKATMTGDEPGDVLEYKRRDTRFPHTPTSDQWFDESQFESYRRLGLHTANSIFRNVAEDVIGTGDERKVMRAHDREKFFRMLAQQWYPRSRAVQTRFTEHARALSQLVERLRTDPDLRFLHAQISPEWPTLMRHAADPPRSVEWLPHTERELRAGFMFSISIIQLMENVYLDLNLEEDHAHPDTRGWMNLFNHWVWSSMFRVTWAATASTFGARFQTFCQKRLKLELGSFHVREGSEFDLNFYEKKRFEQIRESGDRIWLLELRVRNPVDGNGIMSYRFGFAVVDVESRLAYYRVQNHLRSIGLWSSIKPKLKAQPGIREDEKLRQAKGRLG